MSSAPRVHRPRQAVFGPVTVLYIDGASAPWVVVPTDRPLRDRLGRDATLSAHRYRRDAVASAAGPAAARLAQLLAEVAA